MRNLPSGMPTECRNRIRTLLPYVDLNPTVEGLALASKDASGEYANLQPVQNRPWEWTENLGDHSPLDSRAEEKPVAERSPIKNMASLPLELFSARATGERIIEQDQSGADPRIEGNLRMLQEGLSGESIFERDWRESRVRLESPDSSKAEQEDDVGPLPSFPAHSQTLTSDRRSSSRKPSPTSSVRSRGSAAGIPQTSIAGGSSLRQSPFLNKFSGSTAGDPIDVDSLDVPSTTTHSTSAKRKAVANAGDDEVEVIEGPVQSKRSKGKTTVKLKAVKKR